MQEELMDELHGFKNNAQESGHARNILSHWRVEATISTPKSVLWFPNWISTSVSEASPTSILTSCSTNWSSLASWFLSFYEILWGRYYFAPAASKWINSSRFKSFYWKEVDSADFWENSYIANWPSLYILLSAVALTIPVVMFAWIPLLITPIEDSTKSPLPPTTIFLLMHAN